MKLLVFTLSLLLFISCGDSKNDESSIDMDGPDVEINVMDFSNESTTIKFELINRLDEAINNIRGTVYFYDADGNEITYATGRSKSSPFSKAQNPSVVDSKAKTVIELKNSIPEGAHDVKIKEVKVKTTSGKEVTVD